MCYIIKIKTSCDTIQYMRGRKRKKGRKTLTKVLMPVSHDRAAFVISIGLICENPKQPMKFQASRDCCVYICICTGNLNFYRVLLLFTVESIRKAICLFMFGSSFFCGVYAEPSNFFAKKRIKS